MGCDIHLYFEQKDKDGKWHEIDIDERLVPDGRDYRVFGFLSGVRNYDYNPLFENRGIPKDTSMPPNEIECDNNGDGGFSIGDHSFTFSYLDEILNAPWKENGLEDCYFYIFCDYILQRLFTPYECLPEEDLRNVRVIMGFDN